MGRRWPMRGGEGKGARGEERGCWASGSAWARGKERKEGARERGRERGFGLVAGLLLSFLSFFFSTLQPFKQIYLNSNKFESKPYTLNTNKTMLQHECTSKLIL
jgi:hypothetical protein